MKLDIKGAYILDQMALAILDTVVECRKLLGGPFNPSFDPCKHFEDILHKVSVHAIIMQPYITLCHNIVINICSFSILAASRQYSCDCKWKVAHICDIFIQWGECTNK